MSSTTLNRFSYYRQGVAFTAANTTYPVDVVTDHKSKNIAPAADSNTNGVLFDTNYANAEVSVRLVCTADDPPTARVAVYGYVRRIVTTKPNTTAEMDYTGNAVTEIPWQHIITLNENNLISVSTQAAGAVNVIAPTANSWIYTENFWVGGMFERLRVIPVVLTGTNVSLLCDIGIAGGQR